MVDLSFFGSGLGFFGWIFGFSDFRTSDFSDFGSCDAWFFFFSLFFLCNFFLRGVLGFLAWAGLGLGLGFGLDFFWRVGNGGGGQMEGGGNWEFWEWGKYQIGKF